MKIRTKQPKDNKYYIRQANGGYNGAVAGKPTITGANVLCNCVGYANGRFNEIIGAGKCKYQLVCNAENFIEKAKALGLKISNTPVVGGIMVWRKGKTLSGNDGAGHVAIVEKIIDSNTIYTSESGYNSFAFKNITRKNNNGRWGMGSAYHFRGCIVNPAVKSDSKTNSKTTKTKSNAAIAKEVIAGKWGNGSDRTAKLKAAGYDPAAIQKEVNALLKNDDVYYKTLSNMRVRNRPTLQGKILKTIAKGKKLKADKVSGNWFYNNSVGGWVCIKDNKQTYCKKV